MSNNNLIPPGEIPRLSDIIKHALAGIKSERNEEVQTVTSEERTHPMTNSRIYLGAIVLGVLGLLVGLLFLATSIFGTHHTIPYIALAVGAILVIAGIIGMVVMRGRGPA